MSDLKIFTDNIEPQALDQIYTLIKQPAFRDCKVRIMPDAHVGKGCVIGFTADLGDKVIPNIVGVDIGCIDKDTEILTPCGWIRISDYKDQDILVYDKSSETAYFDTPYIYLKKPCDKFYHFCSNKGLDQMLSEEHKMLIWKGYKSKGYTQYIQLAKEVFEHHNHVLKTNYSIKTTFSLQQEPIQLSNGMIRVWVMVSADGCIRKNDRNGTRVELHFSKQRKSGKIIK